MPATATRRQAVTSRRPDRYTIHPGRAFRMLDVIVAAYLNSVYPYGQSHWLLPEEAITLPDEILTSPKLLANFFFWSCMFMRGRIKSVQAIRRLLKLYLGERDAARPCILNPSVAAELSPDYINSVLKQYGLSKYGQGWIRNAKTLVNYYSGDFSLVLDGVTTYEDACYRICNDSGRGYWGFQKKMTSMVLYFLDEKKLIQSFPYPPPVDWHHISLAWRLGIVELHGNVLNGNKDLEEGCLEDLRSIYSHYTAVRKVESSVIAQACWLLGAYLCSDAPGNELAKRGKYKGRSTDLVYQGVDFATAPRKVIEQWLNTCAICPVRTGCNKLMSSGQWYDWGQLGLLWATRTEPTTDQVVGSVLFDPRSVPLGRLPLPKPTPQMAKAPSQANGTHPTLFPLPDPSPT